MRFSAVVIRTFLDNTRSKLLYTGLLTLASLPRESTGSSESISTPQRTSPSCDQSATAYTPSTVPPFPQPLQGMASTGRNGGTAWPFSLVRGANARHLSNVKSLRCTNLISRMDASHTVTLLTIWTHRSPATCLTVCVSFLD
jgi:hypothetical protein